VKKAFGREAFNRRLQQATFAFAIVAAEASVVSLLRLRGWRDGHRPARSSVRL
jgi:hypothetical protein